MLSAIEQNALGHFMYLPNLAGFSVNQNGALMIISCGMGSSMFNIVYGGFNTTSCDFDRKIQDVINLFKGQPFAWWIPPTEHSQKLTQALIKCGFVVEASEHAMMHDLNELPTNTLPANLIIEQTTNSAQLEDFLSILEPYDATSRSFYKKLALPMLQASEKLYVGYENDAPVVIAILFNQNDSAGIFSLLTREDKRGRGFGAHMMTYLMQTAKEGGAKHVTLSASSDSGFRIYERLGFKVYGQFECFEWKDR